jgi:zona occludens toxin
MITLITGTPGSGKTAYVVGHIMLKAAEEGRPVFQMGIPDLQVPHLPTPPMDEWTYLKESEEEPGLMLPYFAFPENSLIVLDECQRVYRLRPNGSKVPDHVAAFETHRHTGVDFVLMTQHPQLLDNHVRKLVGRHIHLRDVGMLGRWQYEWPECTDVGQFRNAPVKKRYSLPKKAFSLYKSASLHIKPTRSVPPALYALGVALLAVAGFGWQVFGTIQGKISGDKPQAVSQLDAPSRESSGAINISSESLQLEMVPRVQDRPETAPVYDALRVAREMPETVGCIRQDTDCTCYTHQGSRAIVSHAYCEAWMAGNRPFNPYRQPPQEPQQTASAPPTQPTGAAVIEAKGEPPPWLSHRLTPSAPDKPEQQPSRPSV